MPRKKGVPVKDEATRLRETIAEATRRLNQIEVKECFAQFLANSCKVTFDAFGNALEEYRKTSGFNKSDWSE